MQMNPTLLVMAAGMGSRYGGLKQIDPVGPHGETIIDYSIYDALRAGFGKVVFVIRHDIEQQFRELVGSRFEPRVRVEYAFQELNRLPDGYEVPVGRTKPWGTGQAILMAADAIGEPFAVINADDFYGVNSYRVLADHLRSGTSDYAMVGFVLRNTLSDCGSVARGACRISPEGYLEGVTELTSIEKDGSGAKYVDEAGGLQRMTGSELVSMNMWGFVPTLFEHLRRMFKEFLDREGREMKSEFYIPKVVGELVSSGREQCRVLSSPDAWLGVTYREDRPKVTEGLRQLISSGAYPEKLWA